MVSLAAEVADGLLVMPFNTARHFRLRTQPAIHQGLARAGRSRSELTVTGEVIVCCGRDEAELEEARSAGRWLLSFYASTPAYRPVLELHGWGDLQTELNTLSKRGAWDEMAGLIDDDMLNTFAVVGELDDIAGLVLERFTGVVDRFNFYAPYRMEPERWAEVLAGFK